MAIGSYLATAPRVLTPEEEAAIAAEAAAAQGQPAAAPPPPPEGQAVAPGATQTTTAVAPPPGPADWEQIPVNDEGSSYVAPPPTAMQPVAPGATQTTQPQYQASPPAVSSESVEDGAVGLARPGYPSTQGSPNTSSGSASYGGEAANQPLANSREVVTSTPATGGSPSYRTIAPPLNSLARPAQGADAARGSSAVTADPLYDSWARGRVDSQRGQRDNWTGNPANTDVPILGAAGERAQQGIQAGADAHEGFMDWSADFFRSPLGQVAEDLILSAPGPGPLGMVKGPKGALIDEGMLAGFGDDAVRQIKGALGHADEAVTLPVELPVTGGRTSGPPQTVTVKPVKTTTDLWPPKTSDAYTPTRPGEGYVVNKKTAPTNISTWEQMRRNVGDAPKVPTSEAPAPELQAARTDWDTAAAANRAARTAEWTNNSQPAKDTIATQRELIARNAAKGGDAERLARVREAAVRPPAPASKNIPTPPPTQAPGNAPMPKPPITGRAGKVAAGAVGLGAAGALGNYLANLPTGGQQAQTQKEVAAGLSLPDAGFAIPSGNPLEWLVDRINDHALDTPVGQPQTPRSEADRLREAYDWRNYDPTPPKQGQPQAPGNATTTVGGNQPYVPGTELLTSTEWVERINGGDATGINQTKTGDGKHTIITITNPDGSGTAIPVGFIDADGKAQMRGNDVGLDEFWDEVYGTTTSTQPGTGSGTTTGTAPGLDAQGNVTTSPQAATTAQPASQGEISVNNSSGGGSGGGYTNSGGSNRGGYSNSNSYDYPRSSSKRSTSVGQMFAADGEEMDLNDFLKDYNGNGEVDEEDRRTAGKRFASYKKKRGRKGKTSTSSKSGFSNVPQREDSPIRTKTLNAIKTSTRKSGKR
jgi:hypothetical protein